jgi:4-amino-4-deoxy-L-arabinose transferase-like glycosyltransferase
MTYVNTATHSSVHSPLLILIVAAYLVVAGLYATQTPDWQAPDEPAHWNVIAQWARGDSPVIQAGDWDSAYLDAMKAAKFSPGSIGTRFDTIQYEDHQPPLYYWLLTPVFAVTFGNLWVLRVISASLGVIAIVATYYTVRRVFDLPIALAAAAFYAFLPQHVAILASVNNDALADVFAALILLMSVVILTTPQKSWRWVLYGALLGGAFLTKLTLYPFAAVVLLTILLRVRRDRIDSGTFDIGKLIVILMLVFVPAILIGSIYWLRNLSLYGFPDFLAQAAHDAVVVGQPTTADYIAKFDRGVGGWLRDMAQVTFQSFWGLFGWMGVPMGSLFGIPVYPVLAVFSGFVIIGAVWWYWSARKNLSAFQHEALLLLAVTLGLAFGAFFYYNTKFVQFQGRYLYPALIPFSVVVGVGLWQWFSRLPFRSARWIPLAITGALALFCVLVLFRMIVPSLV